MDVVAQVCGAKAGYASGCESRPGRWFRSGQNPRGGEDIGARYTYNGGTGKLESAVTKCGSTTLGDAPCIELCGAPLRLGRGGDGWPIHGAVTT